MSENKLDRTNLKRQAQRVESYSVLVSKKRAIFRNDIMHVGKSGFENTKERSQKMEPFNIDIKDYEEEHKRKCYNEQGSSQTSENPSSSSESSQEFNQSLCKNWWRSVQNNPNQEEDDASPVMTRSATRKYALYGSIHNRVDFEQEMKVMRTWPVSVCSPPPNLPIDNVQIKDVVSRSLNYVMSFCKYATSLKTEPSQEELEKKVHSDLQKSINFIDLSPYISQEPMTENGSQLTPITLHLNESVMSHQLINVISINNEEHSQALVIQEEDNENELETITLHSGETYVLDNKYNLLKSNPVFVNLSETKASKNNQSIPFEDSMMAVYNDHTYAMRYSENICIAESQLLNESQASTQQKKSELIFQNALKDLLLNTTILQCLVCGKPPQEMIELLNKAHHNEEYV